MRRLSLLVAILVVLAAALTPSARAQQPPRQPPAGSVQPDKPCYPDCDPPPDYAPDIALTPTGTVTVRSPLLTVHWCDDVGLSVGSRWIKVNTQLRTGDFSWEAPDPEYSDCEWTAVTARSQSSVIALAPGNNTIEAYICDTGGHCTDRTWTVVYDDKPLPAVSLAPHRGDLLDYGRCAQACFAATYAQSTVPYFTLNTPRSVTLVYNSDAADARPFIFVDVTHGGDQYNRPDTFRLQLKKSDGTFVTFLNGDTTLRFTTSTATLRLSGQFDAVANGMTSTRSYPMTVVVGADYGGTIREVTASTRVIVVNGTDSPIARGWSVAGIQALSVTETDGSVLITEGDGSATYFQKSGSTFTSPPGDLTQLSSSGSGTNLIYVRRYPDSTKVTFNYIGLMTSVADRFGTTTSVSYDTGRPSVVTDPQGRAIRFYYNLLLPPSLDSIQDAFGRATRLTVDVSRNLLSISDPDAVSTSFTYSGGRLLTVTDRLGATTTLGYHAQAGKLTSLRAPQVRLIGDTLVQPRDTLQPWQVQSTPYAATAGNAFPSVQESAIQAMVTDAGGHAATFTVNALGQPLKAMAVLGDTITTTYNSQGLATQIVDRLGVTSNSTIDGSGFVTYSLVAGDTMYARRATGWVLPDSVWGNGQARRMFLAASNGQVDSVRIGGRAGVPDSMQTTITYGYDSHGRVTIARDNVRDTGTFGHLLERHWYNAVDSNLSKDSLPTSATVTYGYDGYGRSTSVRRTGLPPDSIEYDVVNRVIRSWDGVNVNPTRFFYGTQIQNYVVTDSIMDPRGQVYRTTRNALGWVVAQRDPGAGVRADSAWYDRDGLVRRVKNRRGQVDTLEYDALHRLTRRTGTANDSARYAYSGDGRQIITLSAAAADTTTLDAALRPITVRTWLTVPGGSSRSYTISHTYTVEGWLRSTSISGSYSGWTRQYAWRRNVGVLDTLKLGTMSTIFTYSPDLQASVTQFPGHDAISQQVIEPHRAARLIAPGLKEMYAFNPLGQLTSARDSITHFTRTFAYDSLGHLARTTFGASTNCSYYPWYGYVCTGGTDSTHTFGTDEVGNRDTTITSGGTTTGAYDSTGNRIKAFAGCNYSVDSTGNVTARTACVDSTRFWWSPDGRLDSLKVGARRLRFSYDAGGRLVRRDSASGTNGFKTQSYFLWDGDNLLAELDSTGATRIAEYSYYPGGLDNVHAVILPNTLPFYAHIDAMGNVRALADSSGHVRRTYNYDEWGHLQSTSWDSLPSPNADRARWKGALWMGPDVDLYYMRNRWYEPRTGRFLSQDPMGLDGGINQYAFAGSDPINGHDALGLDGGDNGNCTWVFSGYWYTRGHTRGNRWVDATSDPIMVEACNDDGATSHQPDAGTKGPGGNSAGSPGATQPGDTTATQDSLPTCFSVFLDAWRDNMNPLTSSAGTVAQGSADLAGRTLFNRALAYAAARPNVLGGTGLISPFRSGVFRAMYSSSLQLVGESFAIYVTVNELSALITEFQAAKAGECR